MNPDLPPARFPRLYLAWLILAALPAGAFAQTSSPPPAPVAPPSAATPEAEPAKLTPALKLEKYHVLGSRIRQLEVEGPSPVSNYDTEYIQATGAFTLADFLNRIPQTYSGVSSGRAGTPDELNPEFGQRSETTTPAANFVLGTATAPAAQTGVSGVSLRGLGAGSTLVLVDGRRAAQSGAGNRGSDTRQGFVDLNTIPLGMVERVEVITDGASALYGADAVAGVINIVLKKNWSGTEITGGIRASEHGGGRERNLSLIHGFSFGRLSGTVALDYYDRQGLTASQRSFSANQDHSAIAAGTFLTTGDTVYGRDHRLLWGYPAVVQAQGGAVAGTFDALPGVRVVLVPEGSTSTPTPSQFSPTTTIIPPATVVNASGQRRTNTSEYLGLISPSERKGAAANFNYRFNERLDAYASLRTSEAETLSTAQLSATSITGGFGTAAVLQAANSPFNQNVQIGMLLVEFGPESQTVRTLDDTVVAGVRGSFGATWQYNLGGSWQHQKVRQRTRIYNGGGFLGLLNHANPAQRFNPFIDATAPGAPSQAALLEQLALYPYLGSESTLGSVDFHADGSVVEFWGGPIKAAFGATASRTEVEVRTETYSTTATPVLTATNQEAAQSTRAVFAELSVPFVGKDNAFTLAQRFDLNVAGRYEKVGPFSETVPKIGFSWAPVQSLLLRANWSEGFRAPGPTEKLVVQTPLTSTLTDPRRTPPSTTGVVVTRGSNPGAGPEPSETIFAGLIYEPAFLKGFSFQVNYYETEQNNALQVLSAQTIVNNEAVFPGRVTRDTPTAEDTALGQPGRITQVEGIFVNFGRIVNRSLDFLVDYKLPTESLGRWNFEVGASRRLEATRQLAPGQPAVILDDDTSAPPKWKINAALLWRKGNWSASAFVWYLDGFTSNNAGNTLVANGTTIVYHPIPSVAKLDLRLGYTFKDGVWRGYGKGLRLGVGVDNVFDKEPPFSDTVWGFSAAQHSPLTLGRSYELSFRLPF